MLITENGTVEFNLFLCTDYKHTVYLFRSGPEIFRAVTSDPTETQACNTIEEVPFVI